jgi:hypothetical protein
MHDDRDSVRLNPLPEEFPRFELDHTPDDNIHVSNDVQSVGGGPELGVDQIHDDDDPVVFISAPIQRMIERSPTVVISKSRNTSLQVHPTIVPESRRTRPVGSDSEDDDDVLFSAVPAPPRPLNRRIRPVISD